MTLGKLFSILDMGTQKPIRIKSICRPHFFTNQRFLVFFIIIVLFAFIKESESTFSEGGRRFLGGSMHGHVAAVSSSPMVVSEDDTLVE